MGEYGEAKKVTTMKGAATKNGKFKGKTFIVKKGMIRGKLPIRTCKSFLEDLLEKPKIREAFPERKMQKTM